MGTHPPKCISPTTVPRRGLYRGEERSLLLLIAVKFERHEEMRRKGATCSRDSAFSAV